MKMKIENRFSERLSSNRRKKIHLNYSLLKHWNLNKLKYNFITSNIAKILLASKLKKMDSYVFVASTGRSGTKSLNRIFSIIPDTVSVHEAYPVMNGEIMIKKNWGNPSLAKFVYYRIKSVNIRRLSVNKKYYLETNHMFIKAFAEYAVHDFGKKIKVIHLIREPEKVARSILSLTNIENCYPGTEQGNKWWLDFRAPGNIIKLENELEDGSEYSNNAYRIFWYFYEIEARVLKFKKDFPFVPVIDINTNDLNNKIKLDNLLSFLGIKNRTTILKNIINTTFNAKPQFKKKICLSYEQLVDMHGQFRKLLKKRGYGHL